MWGEFISTKIPTSILSCPLPNPIVPWNYKQRGHQVELELAGGGPGIIILIRQHLDKHTSPTLADLAGNQKSSQKSVAQRVTCFARLSCVPNPAEPSASFANLGFFCPSCHAKVTVTEGRLTNTCSDAPKWRCLAHKKFAFHIWHTQGCVINGKIISSFKAI